MQNNIIKVANYDHDMPYVLPINPSPNLNTQQAVMLFPSLCMFEGTAINEGRGTYMPFTILGAPALKAKYSFSYKPVSIPGMSERPNHKDSVCYGLDLRKYDINNFARAAKLIYHGSLSYTMPIPIKLIFYARKSQPGCIRFRSAHRYRSIEKTDHSRSTGSGHQKKLGTWVAEV
jgi:hypothetical protein